MADFGARIQNAHVSLPKLDAQDKGLMHGCHLSPPLTLGEEQDDDAKGHGTDVTVMLQRQGDNVMRWG